MINPNDRLQYKDVISKSFLGPIGTVDLMIMTFMDEIIACKVNILGPLFYCLEISDDESTVRCTVYMPLHNEPKSVSSGLMYHSFFSIGRVFSTYIKDDFSEKLMPNNNQLLSEIKTYGCEPTTPLFIQLGMNGLTSGCFLKIGVAECQL